MKNKKIVMMALGLLLCAGMLVRAEEKPPDEKKLDKASMEVEDDAGKPEGGAVVVDKLKAEFGVDEARIQGLRDQKLGYGGVSIALSLAQTMPGGITDENVQKIMTLRQGPPVMGWGKIAKELGLKLGPVVSKVKKVSAEARKHQKAEKMRKEKREKGERMGKPDRPAKMDRPEKGGRPDKPGKR